MARPSKLSPAQWEEIKRRRANGEGVRDLAREFKVSPGAISTTVSKQAEQIKTVANQIVAAEESLRRLSVHEQRSAISMAEQMRQIGRSMAAAASLSAATAHRLHALANQEAQKLDDADPLSDRDRLLGVQALTKVGNEASVVPMQIMQAVSKGGIAGDDDPDEAPQSVAVRVVNARRDLPVSQ